jgi:hypothetical protein
LELYFHTLFIQTFFVVLHMRRKLVTEKEKEKTRYWASILWPIQPTYTTLALTDAFGA